MKNLIPILVLSLVNVLNSNAQEAFGTQFIGTNGLTNLYKIDITTGATTLVGAVGFERCGSLEYDPSTGKLFALCERISTNVSVLVDINTTTGVGTEIGPTGFNDSWADLAIRPTDGVMFGYNAASGNHRLFTINKATGAATLVGSTGLNFNGGNGIEFDATGTTLYHSNRSTFNTLNTITGAGTSIGPVNFNPSNNARISGMDLNIFNGIMYGILQTNFNSGPDFFCTIDLNTRSNTNIAQLPAGFDGFAITGIIPAGSSIPTLGEWGLIILMLLLIGIGSISFMHTHRQKMAWSHS